MKKYRSLTSQAEDTNTYESYKKLIEMIRQMDYEEMYDLMSDTETALKVLCRKENKAGIAGLCSLTTSIVKLGMTFLKTCDSPMPFKVKEVEVEADEPYTGYTYEFIEKEKAKKEAVI